MNKSEIRKIILTHAFTREVFFLIGKRKANLNRIDKALLKGKIQQTEQKEKDLIVSLTSYGTRIKELKYTLYSLITQTILPEKIVVNIAEPDRKYLDSSLCIFEKYGVEFNICEDLRSYKKLIPTLKKFPNKVIVTADDDLYFRKNWLKKLWIEHLEHKNDVICHLAYKIQFENNNLLPYRKWFHGARIAGYDNSIFLLGGAGCLYPPESLMNDVADKTLFMSISPYADDMWFYFMTILNKTKIRQVQNKPEIHLCYVNPYREYGLEAGQTLTNINVGEGQNDTQFKAILDHYNISEEKFIQYLNGNMDYLVE